MEGETFDGARGRRRRVLTLAVGFALLAAGLVATLSQASARRTGTNGIPARSTFGTVEGPGTVCQFDERIPSGTAAIRVSLVGDPRATPRLSVALARAQTVRAASGPGARWDGPASVLVPLTTTLRRDLVGSVCIRFLAASPPAQYALLGIPIDPSEGASGDGEPLPGRLHLEYLGPGERSWWSLAGTIGRRMGFGHAWSGPSVALLALLLTFTSIALATWHLSRAER